MDIMGCNTTPRALWFMESTLGVGRQGPGRVSLSPTLSLSLSHSHSLFFSLSYSHSLCFSFSLIIFKARSNWLLKSLALWAGRVKVNG